MPNGFGVFIPLTARDLHTFTVGLAVLGIRVTEMKIILEDIAYEKGMTEKNACIAVPLELTVDSTGEASIKVYPCFEEQAKEFVECFADVPFSREAVSYVTQWLTPIMEDLGYEADDTLCAHLLYFYSDGTRPLIKKEPLLPVVMISETKDFDNYKVPCDMVAEVDDGDSADVYFAALDHDRIVSYAGVNDLCEDGSLEINVETLEDYKRKGLGSAVTTLLTEHLTALGERVSYCCGADNLPSAQLAKGIGLSFEKETFSFVYYLCE